MATVLMWRACSATQQFYGKVLRYRHKLTLDGESQRFFVETRPMHLIPFWLSFLPTTIELLFAVCIVREYMNGNPLVTYVVAILNVSVASFILLSHGLNYVFLLNHNELCNLYFNSLILYDLRLNRNGQDVHSNVATLRLLLNGNCLSI